MKKILMSVIMVVLFGGCFTKSGDRNLFELSARVGHEYMYLFIKNNKDELETTSPEFIQTKYWYQCLDKNNIKYELDFGLPKTPSETLQDGVGDCVHLSIFSVWNYGYGNIKYWGILGNRDQEMHQIVIYKDNRVISSTRSYRVNSLEDLKDKENKYCFFNIYSADFDHELDESELRWQNAF